MKRILKVILLAQVFLLTFLPLTGHTTPRLLPGSGQPIEQAWLDRWRMRASDKPEFINRLVLSDSAYLTQHADNPIDWYPWNEAAFARAKDENKLIFLSIGYASCHWCHVMEAESFSDLEVAVALNQAFVSIKVDREQLPDIDAYYTLVVETIKGESGWPMTVVLTPDRKPVFAANYLGKEQLLTVLKRLDKFWRETPRLLEENARLFAGEIEQRSRRRSISNIKPDVPWEVQAQKRLLAGIDTVHGGFGHSNKFPDELKLQFLLNVYKSEPAQDLKKTLIRQLDNVMNSGLSDVVFGGVFRYTTDREMTRPHFEKMLYNQALVVTLFADAANWLEKPVYRQYADSVIRFVNRYMRLDGGGFAAAIDADHDGREGAYYLWTGSALDDLPAGISKTSVGDNEYYLYGPPVGLEVRAWQSRLRQSRNTAPRKIENRLTAWNALWIAALLQAGETAQAISLAEVIWTSAWDQNQLYRMRGQHGFLDDYSYLSNAMWQLYLRTGGSEWKRRARLLDRKIFDLFYRQGSLSYASRKPEEQYAINVYQDKELPSPLAAVLKSFSNHQTELEFIEAYDSLKADAYAAIGNRPEYYLSLVQQNLAYSASEHVIAKGRGMISLRAADRAGQWQLVLKLDPDWHVNAAEVFDRNLVPMQVLSDDNNLNIRYPAGSAMDAEFSETPPNIYSDKVMVDIISPPVLKQISLRVKLQACSSRVCLLPEVLRLHAFKIDRK